MVRVFLVIVEEGKTANTGRWYEEKDPEEIKRVLASLKDTEKEENESLSD